MGTNGVFDIWSEIASTSTNEELGQQEQQAEVAVIYRRRRERSSTNNDTHEIRGVFPQKHNRLTLVARKISWNRSLSIRGRTSIAISSPSVRYQPPPRQQKGVKRKPPVPRKKNVIPTNFEKERAYFQEIDSFELLEESPSPKNFGTWAMGAAQSDYLVLPKLNTRLGKWLVAKNLNFSCGPSSTLTNILRTPMMPLECINSEGPTVSEEKTPEKVARRLSLDLHTLQTSSSAISKDLEKSNTEAMTMDEGCEEIQKSIERLSLTQRLSFLNDSQQDPFMSLLRACKQSAPSTLLDLFSQYCIPGSIVKIGEGTFGEAFRAGGRVCKIVPIDGDLKVNGEDQKRSSELLEEVLLSWALNSLKGQEGDMDNTCTTFIETIDVRVCQGAYDASLIKAWEDWDVIHHSENDHPKEFPGEQCYLVFVLAHGGKDLESFVLSNFEEAQSLLVQVASALAVAEAAYEFEHRDLHWGNILLTRTEDETKEFVLEGRQMWAKTFGLSISIIDFTLSRINTGEAIHYLDLSNDPQLFKGPKGCKQSETYRQMKEVTGECWEGSFPKTNVLWLQYLVDILLTKKSFNQTRDDARCLRSLKKQLGTYGSAKEAIADPFFSSLLLDKDVELTGKKTKQTKDY